jgi:hypothetical protein
MTVQELLLKCVVIKTLFRSKITLNELTSTTCEQGNGEYPTLIKSHPNQLQQLGMNLVTPHCLPPQEMVH